MSNDDTEDLRKEARRPSAQRLMNQLLNIDGPKGNNPAYDRGYEFSFRFSDADRSDVNYLMDTQNMTFEQAFDAFMEYKKNWAAINAVEMKGENK